VKPEEILEALRLALASGAIHAEPYNYPYPTKALEMWQSGPWLCLKWMGAELHLCPQGEGYERPVHPTKVQES